MKAYLKKNKPMLILPLVLLPFVVLLFYILGGGGKPGGNKSVAGSPDSLKGANYNLPDADHSLEIQDKTAMAGAKGEVTESRDYNILGQADESLEASSDSLPGFDGEEAGQENETGASLRVLEPGTSSGEPEELLKHIRAREQQIRRELKDGQVSKSETTAGAPARKSKDEASEDKQLKRPIPTTGQGFPVSGIEELDQVFRQNQQLTRQNDSLQSSLKEAAAFRQKLESERIRSFDVEKGNPSPFTIPPTANDLLKAEVYETTTVLTGNRVKLRLLEDASVAGVNLPAGTFIYGICEVGGERLGISVGQLPLKDSFVLVKLSVFDLDGLEGLYVPDNAARKVSKEVGSSTNTSSLFGATENPLTYAGVQAADRTAQSLLRMVKIKKVTVKKNTLVYLINQTK